MRNYPRSGSVRYEPRTEWWHIIQPPGRTGRPAVEEVQTLQITVGEVRQGRGDRACLSRKISVRKLNQLAPIHRATFGEEIVAAFRRKMPKDEPFLLFRHS